MIPFSKHKFETLHSRHTETSCSRHTPPPKRARYHTIKQRMPRGFGRRCKRSQCIAQYFLELTSHTAIGHRHSCLNSRHEILISPGKDCLNAPTENNLPELNLVTEENTQISLHAQSTFLDSTFQHSRCLTETHLKMASHL